ncbi:MAG: hypothetical protein GF350_15385, partial [Chitinivibrionales bacterium]|nr:hypothetical protein [Chitinivibrionales bacterium]
MKIMHSFRFSVRCEHSRNRILHRYLVSALLLVNIFSLVESAIQFDNSSSAPVSEVSSRTWDHTIGGESNRVLIVGIAAFEYKGSGGSCPTPGNHVATSVTYNGADLTQITYVSDCGWSGDVRAEMWYLLESGLPSAGTYEIQVSFTSEVDPGQCGAITLSGVEQIGTVPEVSDKETMHSGGFTTFSYPLTTLTDGAWIVDVSFPKNGLSQYNAQTPNQTNQEERIEVKNYTAGLGMSTREIPTAGQAMMGWDVSVTANQLAYLFAAFAPAVEDSVPPSGVSVSPSSSTIAVGGSQTFTASVGDGTPPFGYQWKRGTTNVGSNQSTLTISNASPADAGTYTVTVTNAFGNATSNGVELTVLDTAAISQGPDSTTRENGIGDNATFSVTATGDNLQYQWRKNGSAVSGTNISGQNTATLKITNITYADSGNYSCRVYNAVSDTTSGSAKLTVIAFIEPPTITTPPQDQTVQEYQTAVFSVTASDSSPDYQWFFNGDTIPGATSYAYQETLVRFIDSGYYSVKVWNKKGSDSAAAYLTVTAKPPLINLHPRDTTVAESASASFSCGASGSEPRTYTWYRQGESQALATGTDPSLQLNTVPVSLDGSIYYCVVSNDGGVDTSHSATLRVTEKVRASFTADPLKGPDSVTTVFTNTTTGYVETCIWYWGDGDSLSYAASSPPSQIAHTYRDTGTFSPYLVAIGNALSGNDTAYLADQIEVYDKGDNELIIDTIRYISSTELELTIGNLDSLPQGPLPPPPTQVGLWYSKEGRDNIDTSTANMYQQYQISTLEADPVITLSVEAPSAPSDAVYGFWISPLWETGPSLYNTYNSARIKMTPPNEFSVSGSFRGNTGSLTNVELNTADSLDMALAYVDNALSELDTNGIAEIILQYKDGDNTIKATDTLPIDDFRAGIDGNRYTWAIEDPDFYDHSAGASDTQTVSVSVWQVGRNGLESPKKTGTFLAGWLPPINGSSLTVDSTKATRIWFHWDAVDNVDSIRILLAGPPDSITTGRPTAGELSRYDIYSPQSISEESMIVSGLEKETKYYIAMQVQKNLLWSEITAINLKIAETGKIDPTDIVLNTAVIDSAQFNTNTNGIDVYWSVEMNPEVDLDLGVTWSLDAAAAITDNPDDNPDKKTRSFDKSTGRESGVFTLVPGPDLIFDTTYHIGLWLRSSQGPWTEPADSGIAQVPIPSFTWQAISYFTSDTMTVFNGKVVFIKGDYNITAPMQDTIDFFAPDSTPDSIIPVSAGFSLRRDAFQPFTIGIYYDSVPAGYSAADIGLYRDSGGVLIAQHGFSVDSANNLVYYTTDNFVDNENNPLPFIVMVDGSGPLVTFGNDTSSAVNPATDLQDMISIDDNVSNVKWTVYFAKDNSPFHPDNATGGYATGIPTDTIISTIVSDFITEETGVRALLVVSDGVHTDTINISRRANRTNSDVITTETMEWVPLSVTAELTDPSVPSALRNLAAEDQDWAYTPGQFRIFRWVRHASNENKKEKWVEYGNEKADLFAFTPGKLIWIKTREATPIGFGEGKSVSLKDTFEMELPAGEWTDFALPFKFNIAVGDIIGATGEIADSLEFYTWEKEEIGDFNTRIERYYSDGIYIPIIPGLDRKETDIVSQPLSGHT